MPLRTACPPLSSDRIPARTRRVALGLHAGMIRINGPTTGADYWAPFGGERGSSYGPHEQGRAAREFYTRTRTITVVDVPS